MTNAPATWARTYSGNMSATNTLVNKAFGKYRKQMEDEVEKQCRSFCVELCRFAVWFRLRDPNAHNFTGNLINSIVVALYRKKKPVYASYANDIMPKAISGKMTNSHGRYLFRRDYDSEELTTYVPEVETDESLGLNDAIRVVRSYKPVGNNMFDILVAYSAEYAEFVENERASTGFLNTYDHARYVGIKFLGLPKLEIIPF